MSDNWVVTILWILIPSIMLVLVLRGFYSDLKFYRANGWDFTKQGGARGIGPTPDSQPALYEFSPKFRVLIYTPLCVVVLSTTLIIVTYRAIGG